MTEPVADRRDEPVADPLAALLDACAGAGLDLDAENARDALWLVLRRRESGEAASEPAAAGRSDPEPGATDEPGRGKAGTTGLPEGEREDLTPERAPDAGTTAAGGFASGAGAGGVGLRRVGLRSAASLPGARLLGRALRPLRRQVAAPVGLVFDEAATVERIAEEEVWLPVFRPATERWLEVALVVDASVSMWFWRDAARELERTLRYSGAFRMVSSWWLDTAKEPKGEAKDPKAEVDGGARVYARDGDVVERRQPRRLREVTGPGSRRLVLVLSDCVAPGWTDGTAVAALLAWARTTPVALIQVLPEGLWERTALGDAIPIDLRAASPATTNRALRWKPRQPWLDPRVEFKGADRPDQLLLPVASLEPHLLHRLARLVAGSNAAWTPGYFFDLADQRNAADEAPAAAAAPEEIPGAERVARFLSVASQSAQRLAAMAAAAPVLTPALLRLIRDQLLPGAGQQHEAEVVLGGLLKLRTPPGVDPRKHEGVSLGFFDGVRPLLLQRGSAHETLEVLKRVAREVEAEGFSGKTFEAWLEDPEAAQGAIEVTREPAEGGESFLAEAAGVLGFLGGAHAGMVRRVEGPGGEKGDGGEASQEERFDEGDSIEEGTRRQGAARALFPHDLRGPAELIGRNEELQRLEDWWFRSGRPIAALTGPEGSGKTALARAFALARLNPPTPTTLPLGTVRTLALGSASVRCWSFGEENSVRAMLESLEVGSSGSRLAYLEEESAISGGESWTGRWLYVLDEVGRAHDESIEGMKVAPRGAGALAQWLRDRGADSDTPGKERVLISATLAEFVKLVDEELESQVERIVLGGLDEDDVATLLKASGVPLSEEDCERLAKWSPGLPGLVEHLADGLRHFAPLKEGFLERLLQEPSPTTQDSIDATLDLVSDALRRNVPGASDIEKRAGELEEEGQWTEAIGMLELLISRYYGSNRPSDEALARRRIARCHISLQQPEPAEAELRKALKLAEGTQWAPSIRYDLVELLRQTDRPDQALREVQERLSALSEGQEEDEVAEHADLLGSLAGLLADLALAEQAEAVHHQRILLLQEREDFARHGQAVLELARFLASTGRAEAALPWYEQAIESYQRIGDQHGLLRAWGENASAFQQLDNFTAAMDLQRLRLDLAERLGDRKEVRWILSDFARLLEDHGDLRRALEMFERRLRELRGDEETKPLDLSYAIGDVARLRSATGDLDGALKLGEERIALSQQAEPISRANALAEQSYLLEQARDLEGALRMEDQAFAMHLEAEDGQGMMHSAARLGRLSERLDRPEAARAHYERRLQLAGSGADDANHVYALLDYGRILGEQGDIESALSYLDEARSLAEKVGPSDRAAVLAEQAHWQEQAGNLDEAERLWGEKIAILSGGDTMRDSISARGDLARFFARHERLQEAVALARERLGLAEGLVGPSALTPGEAFQEARNELISALSDLGRLLIQAEQREEARAVLERRMDEQGGKPGTPEHARALVDLSAVDGGDAALRTLGAAWEELSSLEVVDPEALSLIGENYVIYLRGGGGEDFERALDVLRNCSEAHRGAGNVGEAERLARDAQELDKSWPKYE